jgi:hypothetical protein
LGIAESVIWNRNWLILHPAQYGAQSITVVAPRQYVRLRMQKPASDLNSHTGSKLTVERQPVEVFADHDIGDQARTRPALLDRKIGRWRLHDALAASAAELWPNVVDYFETRCDLLQDLGHVLAELGKASAATAGADRTRMMHDLFAGSPGSFQSEQLIFATYQNAGVRVFDITDPFAPRAVAHFVPPAPERMVDPRPNRPRVMQSNDVYVAQDGLMYVTDVNAGLTILRYKG